ncbi:unnamed protein product [Auanema sp. JU1783]|nr:unnamed protein product [Auanema sp. JU1783]
MPSEQTFYDGSVLFEPLADVTGVSVDKINFVMCMFASLPLSYVYYKFLAPGKVSRQTRSLVPLIIGLFFCYFCFGRAIKHLLANILVSYGLMYVIPPKYVHLAVFVFSVGYLLFIHFYRWLLLTSYYLDVTGPIMVAVQKITTVAFSLHDGRGRKPESLSDLQKKEAIREIPNIIDYLSYTLNFQTVLTGPLNYYADYIAYLDGTNLTPGKDGKKPSPTGVALRKIVESLFYLYIVVFYVGKYPTEIIAQEEYLNLPILQWAWWWFFTIFLFRVNYYFAWTFADGVCNLAGFGFSGYNKEGEAQWDLCTNVKPLKVEMAQSFKETLDAWNTQTGGWLRRVAYDRTPKSIRTVATYVLSAIWHGISVGYYITFLSGALMTLAGATFRRSMRFRFVNNPTHKRVYDFVTFLATKVALAYSTYSFTTMHLNPGWFIYSRVFFCVHILAFAIQVALPSVFPPEKKKKPEDGTSSYAKKSE